MEKENVQQLLTDQIDLPADNMRSTINRDDIFELAADIRRNGLISPITVRPKGDRFELVAGQRRYLAHQYGGFVKINCIVRVLTDKEALAVMTSENLSRVDVNPVDEAKHVLRFYESVEGDIKECCHVLNRGEQWVRDRLAIATMPDYLQELLATKQMKLGVALILNQITADDLRRMWTYQAVRDGANVQLAEYWLSDFKRRFTPDGKLLSGAESADALSAPRAVLFKCSIDGKEYDVRAMKSIMIYEGNVDLFNGFVEGFRAPAPEMEIPPEMR